MKNLSFAFILLISLNSFAQRGNPPMKKMTAASAIHMTALAASPSPAASATPTATPVIFTLPCPADPTVGITCTNGPNVYCSTADALVPSGWSASSLLSTGVPGGLPMPNAKFLLTGATAKQGSAFLATCNYKQQFYNITFTASRAYTPPTGSTCNYVAAQRSIVCQ